MLLRAQDFTHQPDGIGQIGGGEFIRINGNDRDPELLLEVIAGFHIVGVDDHHIGIEFNDGLVVVGIAAAAGGDGGAARQIFLIGISKRHARIGPHLHLRGANDLGKAARIGNGPCCAAESCTGIDNSRDFYFAAEDICDDPGFIFDRSICRLTLLSWLGLLCRRWSGRSGSSGLGCSSWSIRFRFLSSAANRQAEKKSNY